MEDTDKLVDVNDLSHSPTFSVIIATYNRAHLVGRAIRSVLAQTYQDFEIIVVDDASTDDTPQAVAMFDDPRILYIRREVNGGVAVATNMGIRQARGQWICILGDDDEYLPSFLAETCRTFEQASHQVGFGWCGVCVVRDTDTGEEFLHEKLWQPSFRDRYHAYLSFLESRRLGSGEGFTVRASCFDLVGLFDETIRAAVDAEFFLRIVQCYDFVVTPKILVKIHRHSSPNVNTPSPYRASAYERIIEKNIETLRAFPRLWATLHSKTAALHYQVGNKQRARIFIRSAIAKDPLYPRIWLTFILFELFGTASPGLRKTLGLSS